MKLCHLSLVLIFFPIFITIPIVLHSTTIKLYQGEVIFNVLFFQFVKLITMHKPNKNK